MTDLRGWPQTLIEIAEVIGVAATLKLVDAYGGMTCYVPHAAGPDHRLVQAIGPEAAAQLISRFAGEKIDIPVLAIARTRKRLIAEAEGSTGEIARRFGVTSRWVRECRRQSQSDPNQPGLFDALSIPD